MAVDGEVCSIEAIAGKESMTAKKKEGRCES